MRKHKGKIQEFYSVKEFEKKYYPESFKKQAIEVSDLNSLGTVLAKESLTKFKHLMQKQKVCI
ncbi:MAG: hypothetical protein A2X59_04920 [Nitrospirae bacterium GWC2_42_7]|nr:MAG: hypothetical protein A2X59_04920 [Nitrospirae bacterium GWC2_42_7]